jgi:nucleotide-binding universal stress UspA family protein
MIKDLLVNLSVGVDKDAAADYAIDLAAHCEAHLAGAAFVYDPVLPVTMMAPIPVDFIEEQRAENERAASDAIARFDRAAGLAQISTETHVLTSSVGGAADLFSRMARRFDLAVVRQAEPGRGADDLVAEAALFQSGRPVIVVPYIHTGGCSFERIMVCWDGGRTAARAIGDALPLLVRAKEVEVVLVMGEEGKREEIAGANMGRHLARHASKVEVKRIVAEGAVHDTLLSYAADISADFIVMGAYGHSRLREFILGGATRGMLESMTVPCLMSH